MRFYLFAIAIVLWLSATSISALPHFFPNISAIPPSLLPNATASAWHSFQKFNGCHAGDKVDGLAKLKQYFHNFGYITNSTSNFTDDFDDALESAIKTYQRNFNLNTTGELDNATLTQIVRPRCGNADIVNGSTSMNSGNKSSSSSSQTNGHFHTVAHYTFFENKPRWPEDNQNLSYAFLPANQLSDDEKAVFTLAFARWAAVTPLTFFQTDSYVNADIRIAFYTGDHGDGEAFDGVLGTLAHSFSPTSGLCHLDGDETWVVGDISSSTVSTAIDLESVAVHEIGHVLGLGHSSVEEAIMYPTISSGERKVELASDDIDGIQELYGSNPNNNDSSTASQDKDTSGSGTHIVVSWWGLKMLAAVGFVLLMM